MKNNLAFLIALIIIVSVTVDKIEDAITDNIFKEETQEFMNKGGRNTAEMGLNLCRRMNVLEKHVDVEMTDCIEIYDNSDELYE